ncbi:hypothetical protein HYW87_01960, partial [Candidatus Roizmanbacteria bacterium]|nr:hypothetical protein [Candidatus Roizmanbacteria bacterium]
RQEAAEKFKARREAFAEKLQTIRDEKKKMHVERISTKLTTANTNRTNHMAAVLEKLTSILDRLTEKVGSAKTAGKDVSPAESAISSAQAAINSAQTAVSNQAGQTYVIEIRSETTLKPNVGQSVSQLEGDLKNVHKLVVDAKQAVSNAVREVAKLGRLTVTP